MKDFFEEHIITYIALFYFLLAFPLIECGILLQFGWLDAYVSGGDICMAMIFEYCFMFAVIKVEMENA